MRMIASAIATAEANTSGEIRVSIVKRLGVVDRRRSFEEVAIREFLRLGMEKTSERTGVLIFIAVKEHRFHILGDEGIHVKVGQGAWDALARELAGRFHEAKYAEGLCETIARIGEILGKHFPRARIDKNELSNEVEIT